ncbi:Nrap protein [Peziza echinospora]|nr:Nrap protein [Peziza echinospora]
MAPTSPLKKRKTDAAAELVRPTDAMHIDGPDDGQQRQQKHAPGSSSSSSKPNQQPRHKQADGNAVADAQHKLADMHEYKSNVFRMQTDELLAEAQVDYHKRMGPVEKALHKLKAIIDSIPERPAALIADAEKELSKKSKITIPFPNPRPPKDAMYKFAYEKPAYVNVVGSFALKTMVKGPVGVPIDLVLQMPSTLFQDKDYLNYRYIHKRAYYLACVAAGIQESEGFNGALHFTLLNGDALRPALIVAPSTDGGDFDFSKSKCTIRIIPCITPGTFSLSKLAPNRNCVRPSGQADSTSTDTASADILPPTPSYNSSILADSTYLVHLKLLYSSASQCNAFRDACILGRTWLRQRGFTSDIAFGGFGNFEWSILMSYLMKAGGVKSANVLAAGFSNYQLFKATLQFISSRDLRKDPLIFNSNSNSLAPSDLPILMDAEHGVNLLFKMTPWSYNMLRHEARMTIKALNSSTQDQFDAIFLDRVEQPCLKYDLIAKVPIPAEAGNADLDSVDIRLSFARKLYGVLNHGLTDRVTLMNLTLPTIEDWDTKKRGGEAPGSKVITLGFLLDGEKCTRAMDHGPPASSKKEAAAFRKFWGDKAELRRFKDGSILESVFWGDSKDGKVPILYQVISYLVKHHFNAEVAQAINFLGNEYAQLLSKHQAPGAQATTKLFQPAMTGYENLVKDLRALDDLPLTIRHITPISPALRFSTVQSPLASLDAGAYMDPPADIALQFESSGRWPDDLVAIQRTKIAFLLSIGRLLEESSTKTDVHCRVGLENQDPEQTIFNGSFLDVIYQSGPAFRIRIYHEREPFLLERRVKDKTLSPHSRDLATQALTLYERTFVKAPLHTTSIAKLCHRYAFLSPSIRHVKKWFAAHLLTNHFSDEFIELVVLRTFISPFPWTTPSSPMTGFLRALAFLAAWDWRSDPLIVDTAEDPEDALKAADIEAITAKFEALRKSDPGFNRHVLFAATNYDQDGVVWTANGPSRVVAARMTALARSAVEYAKNAGSDFKVGTLFSHALADYDFVIHLNPQYLQDGKGKSSKPEYKNLSSQKLAQIGFDPIKQYLDELTTSYSSNLLFFYGLPSTSTIGCLWTPHTAAERSFKFNIPYSTIPSIPNTSSSGDDSDEEDTEDGPKKASGVVVINKAATINEMARLGGNLVTKIAVNRE